MNIRNRLDFLDRSQQRTQEAAVSQARQSFPLEAVMGGAAISNEAGQFHHRSQRLCSTLSHGPQPLSQARDFPIAHLHRWEKNLEGLDPAQVLYLDTETTGLSGGSGTYAFLVGLAFFEDGHLVIEQLLMREHNEEKAMLLYLGDRLARCQGLVTFNGKSFDIPLLSTRFLMNRLRVALDEQPHLDLLHISRRLWARALPDCRLETLECKLLGLPRQGDVPGWMVPQLYFKYLQRGDPRGLAQVAEHNRRDLLAMVGLLAGLRGYLEEPLAVGRRFCSDRPFQACEDLSLGRWFFRIRETALAGQLCERALEGLKEPRQRRQAAVLLARLYARQQAPEAAYAVWERLLGWDPHDLTALEELAKFHEHKLGEHHAALGFVERALTSTLLTPSRRKLLFTRRDRLLKRSQTSELA